MDVRYAWPHTFVMTDIPLFFSRGQTQHSSLQSASIACRRRIYVDITSRFKVKGEIACIYTGSNSSLVYLLLLTLFGDSVSSAA